MTDEESSYLGGKVLIAMPGMTDERFARTLVYLCAHSEEGAMGVIINRPTDETSFSELLVQLHIVGADERDALPDDILDKRVLTGGPVETTRGFVLHSADWHVDDSTLVIDEEFSLTTTLEVLKAIAEGRGPENSLLALGYAGWSAGQLESEIQWNGWLHCPADPSLVFDTDFEHKYERALKSIGIDIGLLSRDAGHG